MSFGYMSTFEDACAVLDMVTHFFVGPQATANSSKLAAAAAGNSRAKTIPPIRTKRQPLDQIKQDMQAQRSASLSHFLPSILTSAGSSDAWPDSRPRNSEPDGLGDAAAWQAWARSAPAGSPNDPRNGFLHFEPGARPAAARVCARLLLCRPSHMCMPACCICGLCAHRSDVSTCERGREL